MPYIGDFKTGATVNIFFTTNAAAGGAVAPLSAFEAADVILYKGSSATQRTSQAGWTMTSPFDSIVGLHCLAIDLSDNTDSGFYAAGNDYTAVLSPDTETVDGQTVVAVIGTFSIENRYTNLCSTGLDTVVMTDITAVPSMTATAKAALNWLFCAARNKRTQTATTETIYKDDGTTAVATSTKSDDGTTFTRGEYS